MCSHFREDRIGSDGDSYQQSGLEPSLDEMLRDPVVLLMMARDRVEEKDLRRLIAGMRQSLGDLSPCKGQDHRLCA